MVEFWESIIVNRCANLDVDVVPISNWAMALGIGLIALFTIIRLRRMS